MGQSLSWLAFKGPALEAGLERLGLAPTASVGEWMRKSLTGHALPGGWHLVLAPRCDHAIVSPASLERLSLQAEVIACSVEEHVMFSSAEFWKNGEKLWRVVHDAQQGRRHLDAGGALPDGYADALSRAAEEQAAEDAGADEVDFYFEVPLEIARQIAGFKHDEEHPALNYEQFDIYATAPGAAGATRKWWQVWK